MTHQSESSPEASSAPQTDVLTSGSTTAKQETLKTSEIDLSVSRFHEDLVYVVFRGGTTGFSWKGFEEYCFHLNAVLAGADRSQSELHLRLTKERRERDQRIAAGVKAKPKKLDLSVEDLFAEEMTVDDLFK